MPNLKDRFINFDSQYEKNCFNIFKMKTGIMLGPVDFLVSKASISFWTSPGIVGKKKKDELEGLLIIIIIIIIEFIYPQSKYI